MERKEKNTLRASVNILKTSSNVASRLKAINLLGRIVIENPEHIQVKKVMSILEEIERKDQEKTIRDAVKAVLQEYYHKKKKERLNQQRKDVQVPIKKVPYIFKGRRTKYFLVLLIVLAISITLSSLVPAFKWIGFLTLFPILWFIFGVIILFSMWFILDTVNIDTPLECILHPSEHPGAVSLIVSLIIGLLCLFTGQKTIAIIIFAFWVCVFIIVIVLGIYILMPGFLGGSAVYFALGGDVGGMIAGIIVFIIITLIMIYLVAPFMIGFGVTYFSGQLALAVSVSIFCLHGFMSLDFSTFPQFAYSLINLLTLLMEFQFLVGIANVIILIVSIIVGIFFIIPSLFESGK
ncbi:MAG: hypothetical protein L6265_00530 [Thermoplasmatales archaeon]|nr:hypothetical protein [Thermoplasmatales archaeon]